MRLAALIALSLAACTDRPSETPLPESPSYAVTVDSLRLDEPASDLRVAIGLPQIRPADEGRDTPLIRAVNAMLRDTVRALTNDLRPEPPPRGADPTSLSASGGPSRMWLTDDGFSVLIEVAVSVADAPEVLVFLPLSVDLRTGTPVAPADLFQPGTPWADTLAAHVGREVSWQVEGRASFDPTGLAALREGRLALTLQPDGVTVHIAPFQLSSYEGAFHVDVPTADVWEFSSGLIRTLPLRKVISRGRRRRVVP